MSSLLVALLRALKMDADVALVRRGENPWGSEPDYKLPSTMHFNHAIVRVKLDGGRVLWLDPTNPVSALDPYPDISGRPAWVMSADGGWFERLPAAKPSDFHYVHEYEYRFRPDSQVKVRVNASFRNLAPYHLANDLLMMPRSEVLSETLEYFSEGQEVRAYKFLREPQAARSLKDMDLILDYDASRVTFSAGKASFFVIPDGFLNGAFYETDERESDLRVSSEPYCISRSAAFEGYASDSGAA
ncbi:MAG: hypothetical protein HC902_06785 [Calothrix sp. SM1_5_4]|nr:hypothetical protein [Calothrix sp. SM1_5_4]